MMVSSQRIEILSGGTAIVPYVVEQNACPKSASALSGRTLSLRIKLVYFSCGASYALL
jgi:hypothetical protein